MPKRYKPTHQRVRDVAKSPQVAGRITKEKDERVAADAAHDASFSNVQSTNAAQNTSIGDLGARVAALESRMSNQEAVNSAQATRITNVENDLAGHNHDSRYYGKNQTDTWFLRHNSHPEGVQLHGNGYHVAPGFAVAGHTH